MNDEGLKSYEEKENEREVWLNRNFWVGPTYDGSRFLKDYISRIAECVKEKNIKGAMQWLWWAYWSLKNTIELYEECLKKSRDSLRISYLYRNVEDIKDDFYPIDSLENQQEISNKSEIFDNIHSNVFRKDLVLDGLDVIYKALKYTLDQIVPFFPDDSELNKFTVASLILDNASKIVKNEEDLDK